MAKGRMLQNRISKSQKMASLSSDTVRLLYTWLLSHLDINGNFYADPIMVNNLVFTRLGHSIKTISSGLDELSEKGLIIRYQVNGEEYLKYPDFIEKQPSLHPAREGIPDIPDLDENSLMIDSCVTHTQVKVKEKKVMVNDGFDVFWKAYPRKVNKREATEKWNKAKLPEMDVILKAIEVQKNTDGWKKEDGKYIPHPSTWINKERWTDEIEERKNWQTL